MIIYAVTMGGSNVMPTAGLGCALSLIGFKTVSVI